MHPQRKIPIFSKLSSHLEKHESNFLLHYCLQTDLFHSEGLKKFFKNVKNIFGSHQEAQKITF